MRGFERFEVPVEYDAADLRARLERTRFAPRASRPDWEAGVPPEFLRLLVDHWLHAYDWPAEARKLNRYPHGTATIGGRRMHFVHAANPGRPAIVLLHGWPYTFAEMLPLADALHREFAVVVPSLPGFVYSEPLHGLFSDVTVAAHVHELMTEVLGYDRYLTYGEDVGTWMSDRIAATYPESVAGIAVTHAAFPPEERKQNLTEAERHFYAWMDAEWTGERGYSILQSTKPDTLTASVGDSPAGLAAWIVEKFRGWSDCGGDVLTAFTLDRLITTVMLYWTTASIGTSFLAYLDDDAVAATPELDITMPLVEVPAGIAIQWHEREYPRSLAERTYTDIRTFRHLEHGGHFAAAEAPDAVAAMVRDLVATLR